MFKVMRFAPVMLMTAALLTTSACAASVYYPARGPVVDRDDRIYYDRGFREGRNAGADDARRGRRYDMQRHGEYRDNRRGDDRGDVIAFRRGFEAGYDEGFRMYARGGYDPRPNVPPPPVGRPVPRDDDRGRFTSAARHCRSFRLASVPPPACPTVNWLVCRRAIRASIRQPSICA